MHATDPTPNEAGLSRLLAAYFDADWYTRRYPDIIGAIIEPLLHFVRFGAAEWRDPNAWFDSAWYVQHYPDVASSGATPLLHYLQVGAAEGRNPHPHFDARYYIHQYPDAADNPLLYHLKVGAAKGAATQRHIDIADYLPSSRPPPRLPAKLVVDVVIPVLRGLQDLQRCLDSILHDPARPLGRVIIIDDHCTDTRLRDWLTRTAATFKGRIVVLHNEGPSGFPSAVNLGIQAAGDNDVVVLHSDTEVPPGWLRRLAAQAHSQPGTATIAPMTNSGGICGYLETPSQDLPFGHSLQQLDDLCRTTNAGRTVQLPVTSGFCMYITRTAWNDVGPFNTALAGGHGSETDFCLRATARGWQHLQACDVFVYQPGKISTQTPDHAQPLAPQLPHHPDLQKALDRHAILGASIPPRFALTAAMLRQSGLPVILAVSHDMGGGISRHILGLVTRLAGSAHFLLLEGSARGCRISVPGLPGHPAMTLPADRLDDIAAFLSSCGVSRVHLHHLMRVDLDIRQLIHRLNVAFDTTVHDYYPICPQINLLPWPEWLYCGEPDAAACNACVAANPGGHAARNILSWRRGHAWQFLEADRVICPSDDARQRLIRHGLGERTLLAPHEPVPAGPWPLHLPPISATEPLRIVLLGVLANHKGSRAVAAVAEATSPATLDLHVIGYLEDTFPRHAEHRLTTTGPYADQDLPALLEAARPHVIWLASSAPETYSYTLSTAVESGLPIVATQLGSFTERLAGRPYTWLVDHRAGPEDHLAIFNAVRDALLNPQPITVARQPSPDFYATAYLPAKRLPSPPLSARRAPASGQTAPRPKPHRPVIAMVPERFDNGALSPCAYIRVLQPLDHPAIGRDVSLLLTDAQGVLQTRADIIVTQRYALPDQAAADRLAAHARATGATLLYDLDDDLLNIPKTHPDAAELRPKARVVRRMLTHADAVWVSTHGLAESLRAIRPDSVVVPNGLDERIWAYGRQIQAPPIHPVRLLCMGTTTHDRDFAMIEPALCRLKAEYGDRITIDVLGMTGKATLPEGIRRIGPSLHGNQSYPGFVHWLNTVTPRWHVGLAPLADTPFNRGKSAIKAMDYAAMGMLVLASDVPVYRGSIADGAAGWLVANDHRAWFDAISSLLRDEALLANFTGSARSAFLQYASLASQAERRRAQWLQLLQARPRQETAA